MMLEACVDSLKAAMAAQQHGADRIELCAALDVGGVTPSIGLIEACCRACSIPVHVLVRPRPGNFTYDASELAVMASDTNAAATAGAAAVVLGTLTPAREVDVNALRSLLDVAGGAKLQVTFHRAFDVCADPQESLRQLITLGVDHLLTSGQAVTAWEGRSLLRELVRQADDKIHIIAGGGVRPGNAADVAKTGVSALHFSVHRASHVPDAHFGVTTDIDLPRIQAMAQLTAQLRSRKHHS